MTMPIPRFSSRLIERLPKVRGRYSENAPIAGITWFRVGGPAEVLFRPADEADLADFLQRKPADVPITVIGVGSNLLVRDGGIAGVVVRLGRGFAAIDIDGMHVRAGAMALDYNVALTCREASLAGFEFLSGIPGTVGGGLRMNAGAYGREVKDIVTGVHVLDVKGVAHELDLSEWGPCYRGCGVPDEWIFTSAEMIGAPGDQSEITRAISYVQSARADTQPIRSRTGGSTFANPDGYKAWRLIDQSGCRGLTIGGAMVSNKHCNFLINSGNATATDLESLGEEVHRRVLEVTGIELEWEIRRIGMPMESAHA